MLPRLLFTGLLLCPVLASAQSLDSSAEQSSAGILRLDNVFLILCGALVMLMQAGFTLVEVGTVRAKNSLTVVMKNGACFCLSTLTFLALGFSLMFSETWRGLFGSDFLWLSSRDQSSEVWAFALFQTMIAAAAATIATMAMGERTRYRGYLVFTAVFSCLIYPLTGHWSWGSLAPSIQEGEGWLQARGFLDFAGAAVVHISAGAAALAGIIVVGPRSGRFSKRGTPLFIPPHNIPLAALGTFLLIFGWFGLTCGSLLEARFSIGRIGVNTIAAAAAGGFTGMIAFWWRDGRAEPMSLLHGIVGGLVAITAACPVVTPAFAVIIGIIAGLIATFGAELILRLKLDDVVNAVPIFLFNGLWGTIALSLFLQDGFTTQQFALQVAGAFFTAITSFFLSLGTFYVLSRTIGLRPGVEEEEDGLDFSEHASNAYPDFGGDS